MRGKPGRIAGLVALAVVLGCERRLRRHSSIRSGVIGPSTGIQPSGRHLEPEGELTPLGNLPTGGALTPNGRFLWALSTGRGRNDVRIVQVATPSCGKERRRGRKATRRRPRKRRRAPSAASAAPAEVGTVVQTIPFPGLTGGVAMSPDGHTAYVSGVADSSHPGEQVDPSVPGREGDVIHVLHYDPKTGVATRAGLIPRSSACRRAGGPGLSDRATDHRSWPRDIAVSPERANAPGRAQPRRRRRLIDTATGNVRYVNVGHYPYGAGITTDGRYGLVSSETEGTVSVIDLAAAKVVKKHPGRPATFASREHRRRSEGAAGLRRQREPGHDHRDRHQVAVGDEDPLGRTPAGRWAPPRPT